ncbi:MAG TPA: hypothetical protein VMQ93_12725, partial [Novosphingobium sp.]|nr:hypothetical protein [Novosphingobium sp.]
MASNAPTQLPAYIQLRYEENGVFDKFESEAEYAAAQVKRRFNQAFAETEKVVSGTVSRMSSEFGKLDLGVGNMRQQAAEIRLYRDTLQQVSIEAQRLAKETGDTSTATRDYLRALQTQRSEATRALQVAEQQVTTYTRLQTALDGSTAANDRLAESQRALYAEQARAAQAEVAARDRQNLYAVGFGYDEASERQRRSNRTSRQNDLEAAFGNFGYKPTVDLRDATQKILDGDAAMDRAAISATTLEQVLGRVAGKGQAVADAHSKMARETEQAAADQTKLALAVERLHGELDPVVAATQRYAADVKLLDQALAASAISEERHAAMMAKVNEASRDGTTAFRSVINSSGAVRVALLQSGQQMQDFAIQVYSGQSATVAMAQQLPQLAFALSGLEGNTNKTYDTIGRFATFLSGPWGLAVGLGVGVLGTLAVEFLGAGNEAEKATEKTYDFSRSIDVLGLSAKSTADAMRQLADATKSAIAEQGDFLNQQATTAANAVTAIQARIAANQAELKKELDLMGSFTIDAGEVYRRITRQNQLREAIKTDQGALESAREAAANADLALSQRRVADSMDAATAATTAYNIAAGELYQIRKRSAELEKSGDPLAVATSTEPYLDSGEYEKRLEALRTTRDAAIKAAADAKKASNEVDRQFGREIDLDAAKSIASTAGFRVTSGFRTRAEQQRLYDTVRTPENPVALPGTSAHERGNALDIAFGPGVTEASIKKAYQAAGVRLTKVLRETGHFHIQWSTTGADKAEREAEELARKTAALAEYGRDAAARVASIGQSFTDTPPMVARVNDAMARLADISDDVDRKLKDGLDPKVAQALKDQIAATGPVIEDSLNHPLRDMKRDSAERLAIEELLARGRQDEAAALQTILQMERDRGALTDEQKQDVLETIRYERQRTQELERQRDLFEAQLDVLDQTKRSLTDILSGRSTDFFGDIGQALKDLQGKRLFDSLFGDIFRDLEDELRGQSPLGRESQKAADELSLFTRAVKTVTDEIGGLAANDNSRGSVTAGSDAFNRAFSS